jgi:formylglycine-generating enzyme required for sulfatase activity
MSRVYYLHDARGQRSAGDADLPLSVGGSARADIVLPGVPVGEVVAYIALAEGHAYIQPASGVRSLFHNHERLVESKWLKSGDQVQIGEALLEWTVQGDQVFIRVRPHAPEPVPPRDPPPAPPVRHGYTPLATAGGTSSTGYRTLWRVLAGVFSLLVLAAAFVLFATPVALRIEPTPETQTLRGFFPAIPLGERLLAIPGHYTVHATRAGYRSLEVPVEVGGGGFRELRFQLEELPGRVTIEVEPAVPFRLFVDDAEVVTNGAGVAEIGRGTRRLRVETQRYLPAARQLEIAGRDRAQRVHFSLQPAWAVVRITSTPGGATVQVDGDDVGTTPLETELLAGTRTLDLTLAGFKPLHWQQEITAGTTLALEDLALQPADGRLVLSSAPAGATVTVDGEYQGTTPLSVTLASTVAHRLRLSKPGYVTTEKTLSLDPAVVEELNVELPAEYGVVFVTSRPADASLLLDGKPAGAATRRLRLTTRPHTLEVRKPGYAPQQVTVTPRVGVSQNVDVILKTIAQAKAAAMPATLTTAAGQVLRLVRPAGTFRMGASRREPGRRANESRRLVQLTRPFYLGTHEVTNAAYRRFRPAHDGGMAEGISLNGDTQPVVNVSWEDAARYCNWLSQQDGLPAAYREKGGRLLPVDPPTTGYRLPTEAEWAYVARIHARPDPARYPWPGDYPPTSVTGNFADARIDDVLADVVPGYDDGYRVTAPVGSFAAQPPGFHDLGGNVAEWTHDFYAVYPGEAERLVTDPAGPPAGEHHVVRDSSWRLGSITELRYSYRDYSRTPRNDLGFRIARYAE